VELAQRFADFVVSPLAQEILRKYGFVPAVGGK
jgi:ABC-type molybdate transport system substrate-binding protein